MLQKVALFDFDNTVAQGDSIARLLEYDIMKHPGHIIYFFKVAYYYVLYLLHLSSFEKAKSAILFPLNYMSEEDMQCFYKACIQPTYYPNIVEEMKKKKEDGYLVILCTASVEAYMQYNDLPIDCLLATQTQPHSNIVIGKNCKDGEKIHRIQNYLKSLNIEIDYENSYGYSDSDSDIPMLSLIKHKKRVMLKTGKLIDFIPKK
ncbi:HAD family hydrolase [Candidatus Stoquefichus massiliensis]|uniref:HAD family hydrolase n=1 Tax=Candidatus Stoquefichus massiliensis TaxID=1470350 RepID=UPI000489B848|nr:HAD family hydrolase [Candidatus Stoquefichus massiliensis]